MSDTPSEPARRQLETTVTGVVAEVLGRDAVTRDDDFFALGGSSLSAAIIASKLEETLGVDVPVRLLVEGGRLGDVVDRLAETVAAPAG